MPRTAQAHTEVDDERRRVSAGVKLVLAALVLGLIAVLTKLAA